MRDAGHEIGLHGYSHENPADMTFEQQKDVLDKTYKLLTDFCGGKPPRGSVAPWWEVSKEGMELLLSYGIEYDHSMSHEDCQMYYLRTGDTWTKIDYTKKAAEWMKPLEYGKTMTGLVEIPGSWYIDDLPPMMFIKNSANSHGWVNPRDVEQIWMDHFDYYYREYDEFIFPMTIHPGKAARADPMERVTCTDMADRCQWQATRPSDARAHHRVHQQARGRRVGNDGRDVGRLQEQECPGTRSAVAGFQGGGPGEDQERRDSISILVQPVLCPVYSVRKRSIESIVTVCMSAFSRLAVGHLCCPGRPSDFLSVRKDPVFTSSRLLVR